MIERWMVPHAESIAHYSAWAMDIWRAVGMEEISTGLLMADVGTRKMKA
jgi:hypothetical protein